MIYNQPQDDKESIGFAVDPLLLPNKKPRIIPPHQHAIGTRIGALNNTGLREKTRSKKDGHDNDDGDAKQQRRCVGYSSPATPTTTAASGTASASNFASITAGSVPEATANPPGAIETLAETPEEKEDASPASSSSSQSSSLSMAALTTLAGVRTPTATATILLGQDVQDNEEKEAVQIDEEMGLEELGLEELGLEEFGLEELGLEEWGPLALAGTASDIIEHNQEALHEELGLTRTAVTAAVSVSTSKNGNEGENKRKRTPPPQQTTTVAMKTTLELHASTVVRNRVREKFPGDASSPAATSAVAAPTVSQSMKQTVVKGTGHGNLANVLSSPLLTLSPSPETVTSIGSNGGSKELVPSAALKEDADLEKGVAVLPSLNGALKKSSTSTGSSINGVKMEFSLEKNNISDAARKELMDLYHAQKQRFELLEKQHYQRLKLMEKILFVEQQYEKVHDQQKKDEECNNDDDIKPELVLSATFNESHRHVHVIAPGSHRLEGRVEHQFPDKKCSLIKFSDGSRKLFLWGTRLSKPITYKTNPVVDQLKIKKDILVIKNGIKGKVILDEQPFNYHLVEYNSGQYAVYTYDELRSLMVDIDIDDDTDKEDEDDNDNNDNVFTHDAREPVGPTDGVAVGAPDVMANIMATDSVKLKQVSWEERRKELYDYKIEEGNTNVPRNYEKNKPLGLWVDRQRYHYRRLQQDKSSSMTWERFQSLQELDFQWELDIVSWEERRKQLENYKNTVGDTNDPKHYKENKPLATWVSNQRCQYKLLKQGKSSHMTEERIQSLNELEFSWQYKKPGAWDERRKQLANYKNTVGDTNVPTHYKENKQLGVWVNNQRCQYRLLKQGKTSAMTEERIRSLNELEFSWRYRDQDKHIPWEERRKQLASYKTAVGHTNVPRGYKKNKPLGLWVNTQRCQYRLLKQGKSSSMTWERFQSLQELDFQWEIVGVVSWEERRKQLASYKTAVGHTNVPRSYKKNKPLAAWVNTQRCQYRLLKQDKSSRMTEERIQSLNELEFNWQLYTKKRAITKATDTESGLASSELGSDAFTISSECDKKQRQ